MFEKMNFGKGVTHKYIDFNIDLQLPLLSQIELLKEDLVQIVYNNYLLDIGWYPEFDEQGSFRILIIKDKKWDNPMLEKKCRDLDKLDNYVKEGIEYIQKIIQQSIEDTK